jgi:7-cyano-7-deazaguanine synthase in queuosine biosynthesis
MNPHQPKAFDFTSGPLAAHLLDEEAIEANRSIACSSGSPMRPRLVDLLRITRAAFLADRAVPRYVSGRLYPYGIQWRRKFHVRVPVRDASYWDTGAGERLEKFLSWLTDDAWSLSFYGDSQPEASEMEGLFLASGESKHCVLLFSGGVDSLVGAATAVSGEPEIAFVSVHTNSRMKATQRRLVDELRFIEPELVHLSIGMHVPHVLKHNGLVTQRTRALVFLAYGASLAAQLNASELRICENGIGALNLAYSRAQTGAQGARGVHPITLIYFSELMEDLLGHPLSVTNEFVLRTKAEVCSILPKELRSLIGLTVSCDSGFAHRTTKTSACGRCTSCLLRQQGLRRAGLTEFDSSGYRTPSPFEHEPEDSIPALDDMVYQVGDFERHLSAPDPWRSLELGYGSIRELSRVEKQRATELIDHTEVLRMLQAHCSEWRATAPSEIVKRLGTEPILDSQVEIGMNREAG